MGIDWDKLGTKPKTETAPHTKPEEAASVPAKKEDKKPEEIPMLTASITEEEAKAWWQILVTYITEKGVTDVIFSPEHNTVSCRLNTRLNVFQNLGNKENYEKILFANCSEEKRKEYETNGETDFPMTTFNRRFRSNIFKSFFGISAAYRPLANKSLSWQNNGLTPSIIETIEKTKQGLILVTGPTGSGKCLGKGTKVIMGDGSIKTVEEIKTGDILLGPDSTPRTVLSTTYGNGPLYKITPVKGEPWICNDVHIMTLKRTRKGNLGTYQATGKKTLDCQETTDVSLTEFLSRTPKKTQISKYWKLFRTGVEFPTPKEIAAIDPDTFYHVGLWFGIETETEAETQRLNELSVEWVCQYGNPTKRGVEYKEEINPKSEKRHSKFPFLFGKNWGKLCLKTFFGCFNKTTQKNLPLWAKTSTKEQRYALLAGLLDHTSFTRKLKYTNEEKGFVEDITFLARSLGLWATPPKEKIINEKSYWETHISGKTEKIPTSPLKEKIKSQKKDVLSTGWDATPIGNGEYFGFELDGDGRFLLEDFTVTHNSSTICSMLEYINETQPCHIITIEDPIEYVFKNKKARVQQREIGDHTKSFQSALRSSLRQNPDIIFVGEIRDFETAKTALQAAETGHLVFGTLHTRRAYATISRLLEMAPEGSRSDMRSMLSTALAMVICQRLLEKKGGGIWPAREIMILNPAISSLIKEGKEKQINNQLLIHEAKGMMEWGKCLDYAVRNEIISKEEMENFRDSSEDID
jgi:Tfp pilus assembly pilus retraction ATPase PilT